MITVELELNNGNVTMKTISDKNKYDLYRLDKSKMFKIKQISDQHNKKII